MRPLFVYGTLRDPDMLAAVLGRELSPASIQKASAPDLAVVHYPSRVYPALLGRVGSFAEGLLLANLTPDDLAILDAFEGDEYRRGPVAVTAGNDTIEADAYWPVIDIGQDAAAWTLAEWQRNHKAAVLVSEAAAASAIRGRLTARR